ncbi:DUF4870 domain-containing protein [Flavobacterium hydatis]|jgi:hypothetical protein|uniref:DUF4870 domain-containing protein n=1 Tax=Flavobacterium hydatis TaxID=991 RepID=A0A086AF93_FLAHY|nr:DUF4870 domain-containing protein [Flavobacterium hydatis]KFF15357.1 hypothetical protein IW20_14550 [Flavobacterium hydatis]OXA98239.1 hypothetical protein B0A62_00090 [Flavobacterium hydatis]
MTALNKFNYKPYDSELERASNSYLMSLVAVLGGLPLPIMNLLASVFFYLGNRKSTAFVKWHCTQALLAQLGMFFFNTVGFWWTISIIFEDGQFTNTYIAYMLTIIGFNLVEFIFTLYLASQTRKGNHIEIYFFADITNLICKTNENTI